LLSVAIFWILYPAPSMAGNRGDNQQPENAATPCRDELSGSTALAIRLRNRLRELDWTLQMAADRLGLSKGYLSMLTLGHRKPSPLVVERMIRGLNLPEEVTWAEAGYADKLSRTRRRGRGGRLPKQISTPLVVPSPPPIPVGSAEERGKNLGVLIKARLNELDWTYAFAAEKLRVTKGYVWLLAQGKKVPSIRMLEDLVRILGLNEDEAWRAAGFEGAPSSERGVYNPIAVIPKVRFSDHTRLGGMLMGAESGALDTVLIGGDNSRVELKVETDDMRLFAFAVGYRVNIGNKVLATGRMDVARGETNTVSSPLKLTGFLRNDGESVYLKTYLRIWPSLEEQAPEEILVLEQELSQDLLKWIVAP
jgi:transcriptional regulator with XRE-family HTH domain